MTILMICPIQQKNRNFQTGIFDAPAAMPARSKNGFGIAARITTAHPPHFWTQGWMRLAAGMDGDLYLCNPGPGMEKSGT